MLVRRDGSTVTSCASRCWASSRCSTTTARPVIVTGAKQRALLAMLALHPGQMVPADQLVEALWGENPPPAVRNGLQGLVSKLRRAARIGRCRSSCAAAAMRSTSRRTPSTSTASSSWSRQGRTAATSGDLARRRRPAQRGRRDVAGRRARRVRLRGVRLGRDRLGCRSCALRRSRNGSTPSCSSVSRCRQRARDRWSPRTAPGAARVVC